MIEARQKAGRKRDAAVAAVPLAVARSGSAEEPRVIDHPRRVRKSKPVGGSQFTVLVKRVVDEFARIEMKADTQDAADELVLKMMDDGKFLEELEAANATGVGYGQWLVNKSCHCMDCSVDTAGNG